MQKRGFFFTLDAVVALSVVIVGLFIVLTSLTFVPTVPPINTLSESVDTFISTTTISQLNDPHIGIGGLLWQQGVITKSDNTLLQQIGEFIVTNQTQRAHNFTATLIDVPEQFLFSLEVQDQRVYPLDVSSDWELSKNETNLLISKVSIIYGEINGTLWGPIQASMQLWER